ncbi:hypothetical protein VUR80DRAFT_7184 [Thermomyces stellatus]
MQLKALVLAAIAALAAAAPSEDAKGKWHCEPATYSCTWHHGKPGWQVCDTNKKWQFAGYCPPKTKCYFNEENQSPYCI